MPAKEKKFADKSSFLNVRKTELTIPGVEGKFFVRAPTFREQKALTKAYQEDPAAEAPLAQLIVDSLLDEAGNPIFSEPAELDDVDSFVVAELARAYTQLIQQGQKQAEELGKNSRQVAKTT